MDSDSSLETFVQEFADARGMSWRKNPPGSPQGDFSIWPKSREAPVDEDVPGAVVYVGEQVPPGLLASPRSESNAER